MGSEEEQFTAIISTFLSTDNEVRSQAESSYDGIPADKKIFLLLALIKNNNLPEELRELSSVLLRRLMTAHFEFAWNLLSPEAQNQVKEEVIALVVRDTERYGIRKKICEAAAELVRNLIDDEGNNTWLEFLQYLFQMVSSASIGLKQNALLIFSLIPGIFGNQQANYISAIKQMINQSLVDEEYTVRFYAAKALASFVTEQEKDDTIQKNFSDLVPFYLKIMQESVAAQEDDALLKLAIEIASLSPKFLRPHLGDFLNLCLQIGKEPTIMDDWKHLALEILVTTAETIPGGFKKVGQAVVPEIVTLLLTMMTDLDEESDWETSDEPCEEDSDSNAAVAESTLDRFACALGGKTVLPIVMAQVQIMLSKPAWAERYTGLMALSAVGEGCLKQMEPMLPQIMDPILSFLKDPSPRVRYAACNAIGQMATDFAPGYEKKFHSKVIPALKDIIKDHSCPRVQAHAGAALVNFCEECPREILCVYAEPLLNNLEECFNIKLKELAETQRKLVLEQLVTTVASIANTLETDFEPFYPRFMPCMKYIMQNANSQELLLLRGKTIECASLIGLAVGPDKFTQDASDIMDLLLRTQVDNGGVHLADDDPQLSYMITAWARICQILGGERFAPYLPMVMGPVLRTAEIKPELAMLDPDEVEDVEGAQDWELISLGDSQSVGLHTAKLEDKAQACQMLVCYARVMKEFFRPFVEQVTKLILPLLKFYFHDGVRSSAAEIIPYLLKCYTGETDTQMALWNMMKTDLLVATEAEPESNVKVEQLYAISLSIDALPAHALDPETTKKITVVVEKVFMEHFERSAERAEQRKDEDYDEVVEEQLWDEMEEDNYVLTKAAEVIHALLKIQGPSYLTYMEGMIIQLITKLISPERYWQERQWGICIWDDIIEFCGPAAKKYDKIFVPSLLNYLADPSPEVRQACAYGCGMMAQKGGPEFQEICKQAIPSLARIVADPESRGENNISATENAISAMARIIKYGDPNSVNLNELIPLWLSWLPIWEDRDEMDEVYSLLCDLLQSNAPAALGHEGSNLPRIVAIIAETFARKSLADESPVKFRLVGLVRMIQNDAALFENCFRQLTPELQQSLQATMQSCVLG